MNESENYPPINEIEHHIRYEHAMLQIMYLNMVHYNTPNLPGWEVRHGEFNAAYECFWLHAKNIYLYIRDNQKFENDTMQNYIDRIDNQICSLTEKRMSLTEEEKLQFPIDCDIVVGILLKKKWDNDSKVWVDLQ